MVTSNDLAQSAILDFKVFSVQETEFSRCSGENKKGLLLALSEPLTPALVEFLSKILKAIHYDLQQDTLSLPLTEGEAFWFSDLARKKDVQRAIFFGVSPKQAGLNLIALPYLPLTLLQKNLLFVEPLSTIEQNPDLKRKLWAALKEIF